MLLAVLAFFAASALYLLGHRVATSVPDEQVPGTAYLELACALCIAAIFAAYIPSYPLTASLIPIVAFAIARERLALTSIIVMSAAIPLAGAQALVAACALAFFAGTLARTQANAIRLLRWAPPAWLAGLALTAVL